jgi:hypothetical protein
MEFFFCGRCHFRSKSTGLCTICGYDLTKGAQKIDIEPEEGTLSQLANRLEREWLPDLSQRISVLAADSYTRTRRASKNYWKFAKRYCSEMQADLAETAIKTRRASRKIIGLLFHA